jgi:hypothetical protein
MVNWGPSGHVELLSTCPDGRRLLFFLAAGVVLTKNDPSLLNQAKLIIVVNKTDNTIAPALPFPPSKLAVYHGSLG